MGRRLDLRDRFDLYVVERPAVVTIPDGLRDEALGFFLREAPEWLTLMEQGLAEVPAGLSQATAYRLIRAAHSLKGGASTVGLTGLATLAHCLEDVFQGLYHYDGRPDGALTALLWQGFDCLREPLNALLAGETAELRPYLTRAKPIFQALGARLGSNQGAVMPNAADLGVDMVATLFEQDVPPLLARMAAALAHPDQQPLAGELRAVADMLVGLGEMLNLPGFLGIAQALQQAVLHAPTQAETAGRLALADLHAARVVVLAGDRTQGGCPSAELLALAQPRREEDHSREAGEAHATTEAEPRLGDSEPVPPAKPSTLWTVESVWGGTPKTEHSSPEVASPEFVWGSLPTDDLEPEAPPGEDTAALSLEPSPPAGLSLDQVFGTLIPSPGSDGPSSTPWPISDADAEATLAEHRPAEDAPPLESPPPSTPSLDQVFGGLMGFLGAPVPADPLGAAGHYSPWDEAGLGNGGGDDLPLLAAFEALGTPEITPPDADLKATQDVPSSLESPSLWTGPTLPPLPEAGLDEEALTFFAQEAHDLLGELEAGLLNLRADASLPQIHTLMRAAHSLKGGAATVGLPVIQVIAHRLESALQRLYTCQDPIDVSLEEALLRAYDRLRGPLEQALAHQPLDPDAVLGEAEAIFLTLEAQLPAAAEEDTEPFVPGTADLGVDMVATLITQEVQPAVVRLADWLAEDIPDLATRFTGQLEVLVGLGEMLNLSEVVAVAQAGLTALQTPDETTATVAGRILTQLQGVVDALTGSPGIPEAAGRPEPPALSAEPTPLTPSGVTREAGRAEPPPQPVANLRVDVQRVTRLNNLIGELVIQENGALLQQQQVSHLIQTLLQRCQRFESLTRTLQEATSHLTVQPTLVWSPAGRPLTEGFDPLQMDSYGQVYTLAQTVTEEMAQLAETARDVALINQQSQENLRRKQQTLKQIRDDLLWMRMLPVGDILNRFPRLVRDLCAQKGKQVRVHVSGAATLVDKAVLDKLYDPLVHLVRNAFDHGMEAPHERRAQGKPAEGVIDLRAYHRGNQTYLEIRDDGRGIDPERVRRKLVAQGLVSEAQAAGLSRDQLYGALFTPGFSTADQVSDLSGRGVGLDTVRLQVQALKGSIQVSSEVGVGTIFTLRLPLTLTIAKLLVFDLGGRLLATAVDSLAAIVAPRPGQLEQIQGRPYYRWQGQLVPLIPPSLFGYHYPLPQVSRGGRTR
ncbi:MAG: Hpt domain-containing protein, partial [Gloeomargaritaceae cyanobacterium C42_A2020_066]|nr:Hpt domain-containing protein [Gloeomargaritaceae cyanobacterium C42_A2020_066]